MAAAPLVYHYPECSTCRKARKALGGWNVVFEARHIVEEPPSAAAMRSLWQRSGLPLRRLFNTSGQSYRQGSFKDRLPGMSEDEQLAAMAADGKLIKRPILDTGERVLVGFDEDAWREALES